MSAPSGMEISASALTAERLRMDVIANNLANIDSIGYRRKMVVFEPRASSFSELLNSLRGSTTDARSVLSGVRVTGVIDDPSPLNYVYDPTNPYANAKGFVAKPNVNMVKEMVDLITAQRAYQANVTAIQEFKSQQQAAAGLMK